jgi:hypothetical protein
MRQQGKSYRAIAEVDGAVSEKTIRRAIKEMVAANSATELPTTIIGRDHKRYPSSRKRPDAEAQRQ